jgi:hypothetical protein
VQVGQVPAAAEVARQSWPAGPDQQYAAAGCGLVALGTGGFGRDQAQPNAWL